MPLIQSAHPPSTSDDTPTQAKRPIPPFGECSRSAYAGDKADWLHITTPHHFTNFDICPECFNNSIKPTAYARFVAPAPPRATGVGVRCDFSDLWIRVAWAWLYTQNQPDLTLLGQVADIWDPQGACPNLNLENEHANKGGKPCEIRTWHCLQDSKAGGVVEEMTVCSHCVTHIYTILPSIRGIFVPAADSRKVLATCDLMLPNQDRTLKYLDRFIDAAERATETGILDPAPLTSYIKRLAPMPPCKNSHRVHGEPCYTMPTLLPEWTICPEHHLEIVHPLYSASSMPALLPHISSVPTVSWDGFVCQLHSPRLQGYFQDACATSDPQTLRQRIVERGTKMDNVKGQLEQLYAQTEYYQRMLLLEQGHTTRRRRA